MTSRPGLRQFNLRANGTPTRRAMSFVTNMERKKIPASRRTAGCFPLLSFAASASKSPLLSSPLMITKSVKRMNNTSKSCLLYNGSRLRCRDVKMSPAAAAVRSHSFRRNRMACSGILLMYAGLIFSAYQTLMILVANCIDVTMSNIFVVSPTAF